jgi:hypothetical protein
MLCDRNATGYNWLTYGGNKVHHQLSLTEHARDEMARRQITEEDLASVLTNP